MIAGDLKFGKSTWMEATRLKIETFWLTQKYEYLHSYSCLELCRSKILMAILCCADSTIYNILCPKTFRYCVVFNNFNFTTFLKNFEVFPIKRKK
jgi:hypothetical protein